MNLDALPREEPPDCAVTDQIEIARVVGIPASQWHVGENVGGKWR